MQWFRTSQRPPDAEQGGFAAEISSAFTLSTTTRFYGFVIAFGLGMVLSLFSTTYLTTFRIYKFGLVYTLGNMLSIVSSMMFVGPTRYARTMCKASRRGASVVYFLSLFLTLYAAVVLKARGITVLLVLVQMSSLLWLYLSYIPYGRKLVLSCLKSTCGSALS